jgi:hypothetical protein
MGLIISHGCWHGSYSAFGEWRKAIAQAIGIDLDSMEGFGGDTPWSSLPPDPLHILLNHPDDSGEIAAEHCLLLRQRLHDIYVLLPLEPEHNPRSVRARTKKFMRGLSRAIRKNQMLDFY